MPPTLPALRAALHVISVFSTRASDSTPMGGTRSVVVWLFSVFVGTGTASAQGTPEWRLSETAARDWILDSWGIEDGLPQSSVNDIVQTRDGYLWLATFGGLARFDGVRFETYDAGSTPGLRGNRVTALLEDSRGVLWIGFQNAGVARRAPAGDFQRVPPPPGHTVSTVWDIAQDASGRIWFATGDAFLVYSDATGLVVADPAIPPPTAVSSAFSSANEVWLGIGEAAALVRIRGGGDPGPARLDTLSTWGTFPHLFQDSRNRLWLGTTRGASIADSNGTFVPIAGSEANNQAMVEDATGTVWLLGSRTLTARHTGSASGRPVFAISEPLGTTPPYETRAGLSDREGNVWLGTLGGGLLRLRPRELVRFDAGDLVDNGNVAALGGTSDGTIWASIGCGKILTFRGGHFAEVEALEAFTFCNDILTVDGEDAVLIASRYGLLRVRDSTATTLTTEAVTTVTPADDGRVWVASPRNLRLWDGNVLRSVVALAPNDAPLPTNVIHAGARGSLWLADQDHLVRWNGESLERFGASDGIPPGEIRALFEDGDGLLWIGSYGGGLARFNGARFVRYTVEVGLADNYVLQIMEDNARNLWINANRSLSYMPFDQLNAFAAGRIDGITPVTFGPSDGFMEGNGTQHSSFRSPDGTLWFGTIDGILRIDVLNRKANLLQPPVTIEGIATPDSVYDLRQPIRFPPRTRNIEFQYTAASLRRPDHLRFRYRLEGYDDHWIAAGNRRSAFYSEIPPGSYVFRVTASNDEGVWNDTGASARIRMAPSLWDTWWFRTAAAILIAWLGFKGYRVRTRGLRSHAAELQAQILERQRFEDERHALEEQLRQSQKLEAVGQLTGGIAHDFNNLLTVIMGNLELASGQTEDPRQLEPINNALDAANRGAALTQRLLAFSRRQPLRPASIDVRALIAGMNDLLKRTLGEQIDIEVHGGGESWLCEADPTQLENAILNLAINSRDSMPRGGRLTIAVGNVSLDDDYAAANVDVEAGEYVVVSVTDTGGGMAPDVVERAFDPFFTTKKVGRGSGLGLSMVYGFVRQSGGHARISSEHGRGTTVKLYLPRSPSDAADVVPAANHDGRVSGGDELILVVEDETAVRRVTVSLLRGLGYHTIEAPDISSALDRLESQPNVCLLLTDVVLQMGETGADLAKEVNKRRPDIAVLFMSGYTEDAILHHGRLDSGVELLQKPFTRDQLAASVRAILGKK